MTRSLLARTAVLVLVAGGALTAGALPAQAGEPAAGSVGQVAPPMNAHAVLNVPRATDNLGRKLG